MHQLTFDFSDQVIPIGTTIEHLIELHNMNENHGKALCRTLRVFFANRGVKGVCDLIAENEEWKASKDLLQAICNPGGLQIHGLPMGSGRCIKGTIAASNGWSWNNARTGKSVWKQPSKVWANKISKPREEFNKLNVSWE